MNSGEVVVARGRGRGPWKQDQKMCELRRPQASETCATRGAAVAGEVVCGQVDDLTTGGDLSCSANVSNLSPQAKEFYPRNYNQRESSGSLETEEHCPQQHNDSSQQQRERRPKHKFHRNATTLTKVEEHLIESIYHLTCSPGHFERVITPLLDELAQHLFDEETVLSIVSIIIEQSVTECNFRYNGARLCNFLNNRFEPGERSVFRRCLLTRLSEEFGELSRYLDENPTRAYGLVLFMAELFMHLEVKKGSGVRIAILSSALFDALNLLIKSFSTENLKCVCQLLKLTGHALDKEESSKMDEIILELKNVVQNMQVEPLMRGMVNSVIDLREANWGQGPSVRDEQATSSGRTVSSSNQAVLYGPDGIELTQEESQFLNESSAAGKYLHEMHKMGFDLEDDPEMDDEILEAYEEFLESNAKP